MAGVAGDRWAWLRDALRSLDGPPEEARARVVAGVAVAVARRCRVRLPDLALLSRWGSPVTVDVPAAAVADPWLVGSSLEALVVAGDRRRRGVHHTPRAVAEAVTGLALDGVAVDAGTTVCDPAVGGGAFLLAAGEALVGAGVARRRAVGNLSGVDVDVLAAATAEAALWVWSGGGGTGAIEVGDALARADDAWAAPSLVVGNPPFLGQLRTSTARPAGGDELRPDLAALAGPYTDAAALFAALAVDAVAPGGRVALVLPRSFLVARDAARARQATVRSTTLRHVWWPGRRVFAADVEVCVPVWERVAEAGPISRSAGLPPMAAPPLGGADSPRDGGPWSFLLDGLDDGRGVPPLDRLRSSGALGDRCVVNAGFRDQFYGLVPFVVDDPEGDLDDDAYAPLVTSGLVDPATTWWGSREVRYAGRRWAAPRVDLAAVAEAGGPLARWVAGRRVPKLLVAAQTRTVEAVVDVAGTWVPSTPVATVVPGSDRLWHSLAVLLSPVTTAWAVRHHGGSGLSPGAMRLPPSALRALPTPVDGPAWDEAARLVQAASRASPADRRRLLVQAAHVTCAAHALPPDPLTSWWSSRLPAA